MKPTVIDLFAGVGGLSLGFEQAGFHVVLANEYDDEIAAAYRKNHPERINRYGYCISAPQHLFRRV